MKEKQRIRLKQHLVPALDLDDPIAALNLAEELQPYCCMVKVGLHLFTRVGFSILDDLHARNLKVFLDLKFHDIPNTVAGAVSVVAEHPAVELLTVHAAGGSEMLKRSVEAAQKVSGDRVKVIAVTALTSILEPSTIGVSQAIDSWVETLADIAVNSGVKGLVTSPLEAARLRSRFQDRDPELILVTPGIRLPGEVPDDQLRIATPIQALEAGSTYLVVGRPLCGARNIMQALEKIGDSL